LDARRIALLPGSRRSEIRRLLPTLHKIASRLRTEGFSPVFSVAPGLSDNLKEWMKGELLGMEIFEGEGRELLAGSAAAAGASGTVAVEAMLLDRFMVVLYKTGFLSECVWRMLAKTQKISLPNILAGREIYPELLQRHAAPENTTEALLRYLRDTEYRDAVHDGLRVAREGMGAPGSLAFWAERILSGDANARNSESLPSEETSP
jgi:lipid-A-disaccharide synthase